MAHLPTYQEQSHAQSYPAMYRPEPAVNLSSSAVHYPTNVNEQQWKHLVSNISAPVSRKLSNIGVFYIFVGILSIGLEIGVYANARFSYLAGIAHGLFLLAFGIVTLILCHQQIYTLTSLFVLGFFELVITLIVFGFYCFFFFITTSLYCNNSSIYSSHCDFGAPQYIMLVHLIHLFTTFCIIIVYLVTITNARRPLTTPVASAYVVYAPQTQPMPVSFHNPCATPTNQSSSA